MKSIFLSLAVLLFDVASARCQPAVVLKAQLRTRSELRDGYGTMNPIKSSPAFFTSQRTRLTTDMNTRNIEFRMAIQDIRVWGQDGSTINSSDGNRLMLHEGWAMMSFLPDSSDKMGPYARLRLKIGRQTLLYDDSRLLGDLDWLQQGRRHDAVVIKYRQHQFQADAGFAYNQHSDAVGKVGSMFLAGYASPFITNSAGNLVATPPMIIPLAPGGLVSEKSSLAGMPVLVTAAGTNGMNQMYKTMQFVHLSTAGKQYKLSLLFLSDQFQKYRLDSVVGFNGTVFGRRYDVKGVNARFTYGGLLDGYVIGTYPDRLRYTVGLYSQAGRNKEGKKLSAWHFTSSIVYRRQWLSVAAGFDYLSGNAAGGNALADRRFDPLYGTPHKFWGMMDYYYVATGSPTGGLMNPNLRFTFTSKRTIVSADFHHFLLAHSSNIKSVTDFSPGANLGSEFDMVAKQIVSPVISLEFGYSFMLANNNTEFVKKNTINRTDHFPQWAYLTVSISPEMVLTKQ